MTGGRWEASAPLKWEQAGSRRLPCSYALMAGPLAPVHRRPMCHQQEYCCLSLFSLPSSFWQPEREQVFIQQGRQC